MNNRAAFILNLTAKTRAGYGGALTLGGKTYPMTTRSLEPREREYLPEGVANAADADLRVFLTTPTDFQDAQGNPQWPALGSSLSWQGTAYTIVAVRPGDDVLGTTVITLEFFVYRTPAPDSATTETATEATTSGQPQDAGKRKQY